MWLLFYPSDEKPQADSLLVPGLPIVFLSEDRHGHGGSNIGIRKWLIAIYLMTNHPKGVSGMQLHRDIGVSQRTAWFMAH